MGEEPRNGNKDQRLAPDRRSSRERRSEPRYEQPDVAEFLRGQKVRFVHPSAIVEVAPDAAENGRGTTDSGQKAPTGAPATSGAPVLTANADSIADRKSTNSSRVSAAPVWTGAQRGAIGRSRRRAHSPTISS